MRERGLADLVREVRPFACPVFKGAAETVDRNVAAHPPQQHLHCHVAHHGPTIAWKHELVLPNPSHLLEDCYCRISERHTVLPAGFHSTCRHRPDLGLEVYLIPPCTDYLPCPGGGQDREFE